MKAKIFITLCIVVLSFTGLKAQTFKEGEFDLNAGIGLGYTYSAYSGVSSWPAIAVSAEKGIKELPNLGIFSIGGVLGYKHFSYSDMGYDWSWSDLIIGARGAIHFTSIKADKIDVYGGASLGLRFYTYPTYEYNGAFDYTLTKKTFTKGFLGIFAGGKYAFSDKIGAFAEIGYDISWLKIGVTFKF